MSKTQNQVTEFIIHCFVTLDYASFVSNDSATICFGENQEILKSQKDSLAREKTYARAGLIKDRSSQKRISQKSNIVMADKIITEKLHGFEKCL